MLSPILMLAAAQAALFPAQKLAPPTSIEREAQRRALDLIRETYGAYANSTISRHLFVRLAPSTLQNELSKFVWNDNALRAIRAQFPAGAFIVPDVYHEIYVMRPEIDFLDADKKHFDGPKVPGLTTLRSLIYLEGARARFVAETSARNYTTGSFSDQAGRVSSICVSTRVGIPGAGAGPGRGMLEGQVALVRPWAAFGRPRALERGHSGGPCTKWVSEGARSLSHL